MTILNKNLKVFRYTLEGRNNMNSNKIIKLVSKEKRMVFIIQTVIPFLLPFVLEISDAYISVWIKVSFLIVATYIDLKLIFLLERERDNIIRINFENQVARYAYSSVYELNERKRDYLVKLSYDNNFIIPQNALPYDIHEYISEICASFKNVISQITEISKEHMSVSFIYRYGYIGAKDEDSKWRWVTGKEPTMKTPLNDFVKITDTVYYFLINGSETVVFCNDKLELEKAGNYFMSVRDNRHNKIGSIFAIKVMFSNNAQSFAEGLLVISTYGQRFVEDNDYEKSNQLRRLFIDDLFPYYQRLLETELGMLYLKHIS